MTPQESKADRIPCAECGIPIPQPGEYPDPDALLCDKCYLAKEAE